MSTLALALLAGGVLVYSYAQRRLAALAALERVANVQHTSPRWASSLLGEKHSRLFAQKITVEFEWVKHFTGDDIRQLNRLGRVDYVSLENCNLNRDQLEAIAAVRHLGTLSLRGSHFLPEALPLLSQLKNIDALDLESADIDDALVERLSENSCRALCLSRTKITDRCLPVLSKMKRLESLDLSYTRIGGAAFRHVARLEGLQILDLEATDFDDVSAEWISDLTALRHLDLGYTAITDSGVKNLAALPLLEDVSLIWTPVTPKGWASVSSSLPNCHVQLGEVKR